MSVNDRKISTRSHSSFLRDEKATTAVLFAFTVPVVIALVGAGADYGRAAWAQTQLQAAVDSAALAAAENAGLTQSARQTLAYEYAKANAGSIGSEFDASFTETESNGSYTVSATASVPTYVASIMGLKAIAVHASATAEAAAATTPASAPSNVCILTTSATGTDLNVNAGVNVAATQCNVDDASTASSAAAMFNSGDVFNVAQVCVGGAATANGVTIPTLKPNCAAPADPFAASLPTVAIGACLAGYNQTPSSSFTLSPGVYCNPINFNPPNGGDATLTLNPGLYVLKGNSWTINAGWTVVGAGVTFYLADSNSTIQWNSGVATSLIAPSSGTYANVLMFESPGITTLSNISMNGAAGHYFQGLIHLPSRNVTLNAFTAVDTDQLNLVVNSLTLDSGMTWALEPSSYSVPGGSAKTVASTIKLTK